MARVLRNAHTLIKKFNKSSRATEKLIALWGKKLISDCSSLTFLMLERLLAVRGSLSTILEDLGWDNIATSEWKTLGNIHDLLRPFAQYTSLVSGEDYTTISSVLPIIMELTLHLEEMKQIPELSRAAGLLLTELKQRFKKFTNHSDAECDLYLECSMLDPRYKHLLNLHKSIQQNRIATTSERSVR